MAEAPLTTGGSEAEGGADASLHHRPGIEAADMDLLQEAGKQEMGGFGADVLGFTIQGDKINRGVIIAGSFIRLRISTRLQ